MATLTGGSLKAISPNDVKTRTSQLNQLVDVIQEDISGSVTRKKYQVFVTGGLGPGVTSSLYQTVFDQDFSLQTANPIFDMTVGLYVSGACVTKTQSGKDSVGKLLFPSQTLMMREKINIYRQFAATLLGSADSAFVAPFGSTSVDGESLNQGDTGFNPAWFPPGLKPGTKHRIDEALFLSFKRLFSRDAMKKSTFAIRTYRTGAITGPGTADSLPADLPRYANLAITSISGSAIFTDMGANANQGSTVGGAVGNIVNSANTAEKVGLIFYDQGVVVLDIQRVYSGSQKMSGSIAAVSNAGVINGVSIPAGTTIMGASGSGEDAPFHSTAYGNPGARLVPDLMVSASIDDIVDHFATTRFQSGSLTAATFQNVTNINSTIIFCRATADEFNYSTNPTYIEGDGKLRVIDLGQENVQRSFTFPTTVGLHDSQGQLLAVAKMSRPIQKNDEKDITFRIRLDF